MGNKGGGESAPPMDMLVVPLEGLPVLLKPKQDEQNDDNRHYIPREIKGRVLIGNPCVVTHNIHLTPL